LRAFSGHNTSRLRDRLISIAKARRVMENRQV